MNILGLFHIYTNSTTLLSMFLCIECIEDVHFDRSYSSSNMDSDHSENSEYNSLIWRHVAQIFHGSLYAYNTVISVENALHPLSLHKMDTLLLAIVYITFIFKLRILNWSHMKMSLNFLISIIFQTYILLLYCCSSPFKIIQN